MAKPTCSTSVNLKDTILAPRIWKHASLTRSEWTILIKQTILHNFAARMVVSHLVQQIVTSFRFAVEFWNHGNARHWQLWCYIQHLAFYSYCRNRDHMFFSFEQFSKRFWQFCLVPLRQLFHGQEPLCIRPSCKSTLLLTLKMGKAVLILLR